jgi:hypothetical protein
MGDEFSSLFAADDEKATPEGEDQDPVVETTEPEAEPEPEADEDADEDEEEVDPDADPEPEAASRDASDLTWPVMVNGEMTQVPVSELARSYLQQSDYTRKTQDLSDERKSFETRRGAWTAETDTLSSQFDVLVPSLVKMFQSSQIPSAELNRMKDEDPGRWAAYMHDRREQIEMLRSAQNARVALADQQSAEQKREVKEKLPGEMARLMKMNPSYVDETNKGEFNWDHYEKVGKFLLGRGIRPEEWESLYDHRYLDLASLAMQNVEAKRLVKGAQPKLRNLPKPLRPQSTATMRTPRETREKAMRGMERRLQRTGTVRDGAALFENFFK